MRLWNPSPMFFTKKAAAQKPAVLSPEQREVAASAGATMRLEQERYIVLRVVPAFYRALVSFYDKFDAAVSANTNPAGVYVIIRTYESLLESTTSDLHAESLQTPTTLFEIADVLDHREGVSQMLAERIGAVRDTVHQLAFESFAEYLRVADPEQFKQLSEAAR